MVIPDIKMWISMDFGKENLIEILNLVKEFEQKFIKVYHEKPSPRIIRCILKLAEADVNNLMHYMKRALSDWRDVIYWAEYDNEDNKVFSGSEMFKSDSIDNQTK